MTKPATQPESRMIVIAALLCAASMWIFVNRVMIAHQVADARTHGTPRGNLSDLYPRWLGARELLLHGRDPYGKDVTREIQTGYYGRPLDADRRDDPRDQQGFAYPVYVVFYLAPTVQYPFPIVQRSFFWVLLTLTIGSTLIWLRVLKWPDSPATKIAVLLLVLGSAGGMQGLKLQQMSLLVAAMIAIAIFLIARDHKVAAGVVLALATIKPQLLIWVLVWLGIWILGDRRSRYPLAASFAATMAVLFAASEWYLRNWIPRFAEAIRQYLTYTNAVSVLENTAGIMLGRILEIVVLVAMLNVCWRERHVSSSTQTFAFTTSLVLACTVLLVPTSSTYNQVMLVPAAIVLFQQRGAIWHRDLGSRLLLGVTAALVIWPWVASIVVASLSFVWPVEVAEKGWRVPFWTVMTVPVGVAALMLLFAGQRTFAASQGPATS